MTVDQTRVNHIAAVQQAQTILLIAIWKRLVFSAVAYLLVPAVVFRLVLDATGRDGLALITWFAVLPLIHLASRCVPEASLEEVARQFEAQQRAAARRGPSLAERVLGDQYDRDDRDEAA